MLQLDIVLRKIRTRNFVNKFSNFVLGDIYDKCLDHDTNDNHKKHLPKRNTALRSQLRRGTELRDILAEIGVNKVTNEDSHYYLF